MQEITRLFGDFIGHALKHPDGPALVGTFNRTFQFDLEDGEPFFMEIKDGALRVEDGDSGLDWQYRDWDRATCVHTSRRFLRKVIAGECLISEGFFNRELGFAPRRAADTQKSAAAVVAWFYALVRLSHEEIAGSAARDALSRLAKV